MAQLGSYFTLAEAVAGQLRSEIVSGALRPGEPLKDNEICARLSVSSSPVREAIASLATERLVEILPNRRKIVSPIDKKNAIDLLEIHLIFDLIAFRQGGGNLSPADIEDMKILVGDMAIRDQAGADRNINRLQIEFSAKLYHATNNIVLIRRFFESASWLERLLNIIGDSGEEQRRRSIATQLEALVDGDISSAILAHRRMMEDVMQQVMDSDRIPPP